MTDREEPARPTSPRTLAHPLREPTPGTGKRPGASEAPCLNRIQVGFMSDGPAVSHRSVAGREQQERRRREAGLGREER